MYSISDLNMSATDFETLAVLVMLLAAVLPWVFPRTFGQPEKDAVDA
jgi:hypothetical protein